MGSNSKQISCILGIWDLAVVCCDQLCVLVCYLRWHCNKKKWDKVNWDWKQMPVNVLLHLLQTRESSWSGWKIGKEEIYLEEKDSVFDWIWNMKEKELWLHLLCWEMGAWKILPLTKIGIQEERVGMVEKIKKFSCNNKFELPWDSGSFLSRQSVGG